MQLPSPPKPPEEEIWPIPRIAKRWSVDSILAEAELHNAGFPAENIPRKPAVGYRFSDVLAFEQRWREAESAREKKRAQDAQRHAEANERLRLKNIKANQIVAEAEELQTP